MLTARTEQAGPHQQGWELRRWSLLLPILVLAASGCAQQGSAMPQAAKAAAPATVTVGPTDGGRTVDLKVGDQLIVELTGTLMPPGSLPVRPGSWTDMLPVCQVRPPSNVV